MKSIYLKNLSKGNLCGEFISSHRKVWWKRAWHLGMLGIASSCFWGITACSLFDSQDGKGCVQFDLDEVDSPIAPTIAIPETTERFVMELIAEDSDGESSKVVISKSFSKSDSVGHFVSDNADENFDEVDNVDEDLEEVEGENIDLDVETTCQSIPATYSVSMDYSSGDKVSMHIDEVKDGKWIVRVSALDSSSRVLAHVQKAISVSGSEKVKTSGSLMSGPAPNGYLFCANPGGKSVTRVSLFSEETKTISVENSPAELFFKGAFEASFGSLLYAITGGNDLLELGVDVYSTDVEVTERNIPTNNSNVAPGSKAVISYYSEGGVRFYDYDTHDYSNLLYTGAGTSEFSDVIDDKVWVTNENSKTITKIDISSEEKLINGVSTGYVARKLDQSDDGERVWSVGQEPKPFVCVSDSEGKRLDVYTEQIVSPSALLVSDGLVCVGDSSRGEIIFFSDRNECEEIERLKIKEGVSDLFLSDGYRLYALTGEGSLAVVDLATLTYNKVIKVPGDCYSAVWMR